MLLFIGLGKIGKGDTLHCAGCGALISLASQICRIMGRPPRKTYKNPHGLLCPTLTLAAADGLAAAEFTSTENTWFAGYAWRPVSCAACDLFLGWRFEAVERGDPPEFYGLLEERLISRESKPG